MMRAIVLACGNSLRGDDGVGPHIAKCLGNGLSDPEIRICSDPQWTPELAEPISQAQLVIFVDASETVPPGKIACRQLQAAEDSQATMTHEISPESLLALAGVLFGAHPKHAYLLTVGGSSFALTEELSDPVRRAIPGVIERIKALLSGGTLPEEKPSMGNASDANEDFSA
jgi:hydrogenase maturation protease